ncbi:hypothetical protein OV079_34680 [Nannocystis pusilla]|uniref:Tetratricopeptide repeat protein n=1 Tax=Nannocystis pusilla TaxID=889268 RepID=A0A9X3EUN6_9BACT|nr:hypothetical protein [Nannocystis pusilla]MCY1010624.1 hypothetical protein [Nannocystis pusilla]
MRRLALVVALAAACKPAPATTTPDATPAAAAPKAVDKELAAVADRLDPGPQAPMYEVLPTWLKSKVESSLAGDPKSPKSVAEAREAIAAWDKVDTKDSLATMQGALVFARGLILAERAVAAGSDDPELLAALTNAYRVVHSLRMFQRSGLLGQILQMGVEMARKEAQLETQQIEEAVAALGRAVERAPALHMHATARLLREHPNHPTVPEALARASQAKVEAEQYEEALALRRLAVQRKGERASGSDWAALMGVCYSALDVACADAARKQAEALGPGEPGDDKAAAFKKRLADLEVTGTMVRRTLALTQATSLEAQLERGHLLLKLNRQGDAQRIFEGLAAAHPNDARPQTGLGVVAIHRQFDLEGVIRHVRAARKLANHDRLYYEVALGTISPLMFTEVAAQLAQAPDAPVPDLDARFDELLELTRGFRAHDPARAALLELLFTVTREAMPKFLGKQREAGLATLRKLPDKAMALTRKFPESRDAWRLVFSSSRLTDDPRKARLLANAPLPAALQQDPDLRVQQVRAQLDAALLWEDGDLLLAAMKSGMTLPETVDADTALTIRATLDAVAGREGDTASLQRAAAGFAALAERKTGKELALALNNAAMVTAYSGDVPAAMAMLERAAQAAPESVTAAYNMGALAYRMNSREGLVELFAKIIGASEIAGVRLHSRAFLVTLAEAGQGDVAVTREEFAAALAGEEVYEFRGRVPLGRWGVVEQGEFKVSLGYATNGGLTVLDEVVPHWWLVVPAPAMDSLLAGRTKGGKGAKKAAKAAKP